MAAGSEQSRPFLALRWLQATLNGGAFDHVARLAVDAWRRAFCGAQHELSLGQPHSDPKPGPLAVLQAEWHRVGEG